MSLIEDRFRSSAEFAKSIMQNTNNSQILKLQEENQKYKNAYIESQIELNLTKDLLNKSTNIIMDFTYENKLSQLRQESDQWESIYVQSQRELENIKEQFKNYKTKQTQLLLQKDKIILDLTQKLSYHNHPPSLQKNKDIIYNQS